MGAHKPALVGVAEGLPYLRRLSGGGKQSQGRAKFFEIMIRFGTSSCKISNPVPVSVLKVLNTKAEMRAFIVRANFCEVTSGNFRTGRLD